VGSNGFVSFNVFQGVGQSLTRSRAALKYIALAISGHMDDVLTEYKVHSFFLLKVSFSLVIGLFYRLLNLYYVNLPTLRTSNISYFSFWRC
jgi:hypothetical protein